MENASISVIIIMLSHLRSCFIYNRGFSKIVKFSALLEFIAGITLSPSLIVY